MKRRLVAVALTSLSLLATGLLAAAPAAQADSRCHIDGVTPASVTMGLSPVAASIVPRIHGCTVANWWIEGHLFLSTAAQPRQVFDPYWYANVNAGPQSAAVTAFNLDYDEHVQLYSNAFDMLRRTTWQAGTFNASPEPVRKGKSITVKGRLILANWDTMKYGAYANRTVALEFRTPTGTYAHVKYVKTSSTGWVSTKVAASKTGAWRLRYGGNAIASPATTGGDSVTVN